LRNLIQVTQYIIGLALIGKWGTTHTATGHQIAVIMMMIIN